MSCTGSWPMPVHKACEHTDTIRDTSAPPTYLMTTKNSEKVIQTIIVEVQKAIDQLSLLDDDFTDSPGTDADDNNWQKPPQSPPPAQQLQSLFQGRVTPPIEHRKNYKRQPRIFEKDTHVPSPLSESVHFLDDNDSLLFDPSSETLQDGASVLPIPANSRHGHSISRVASLPLLSTRGNALSTSRKHGYVHPFDWTVKETVAWLRSKGFGEDVCQKFLEQEVAGDALLHLDTTKLKTEIGIIAYGKRFRVDNAIAECRRLARIMSSSAIQPTRPGLSFHGRWPPQKLTLLGPALQRSASAGNLLSHKSLPDSGDLSKVQSTPVRRDPELVVGCTEDEPSAMTGLRPEVPSSLNSEDGQRKTIRRSLSQPLNDRKLGINAKGAQVEQDGKGDVAVHSDESTKVEATQSHDHQFDSRSSTPPVKSRTVELLPLKTQHVKRSISLREWRKANSDSMYENRQPSPSGSTQSGTHGLFPKLRRRYFGRGEAKRLSDPSQFGQSHLSHDNDIGSAPSLHVDADTTFYREEDRRTKPESNGLGGSEKNPTSPRKLESPSASPSPCPRAEVGTPAIVVLQIGKPDHEGWMRKKGQYNLWKVCYFVLKGPHLYWLKDNNVETKVEGHVNTINYRIIPDENINPGRYGFKLLHESDGAHFFSSGDKEAIKRWVRILLKLKIEYDYASVKVPPTHVPVLPLEVAQAMKPRPPSPTARAATPQSMECRSTNQLSVYDVKTLMAVPTSRGENDKVNCRTSPGVETEGPVLPSISTQLQVAPVRPPRDMRRQGPKPEVRGQTEQHPYAESDLIKWANSRLQGTQITSRDSICSRLELLGIAKSIKEKGPTVPDSCALSRSLDEETIEALFCLVDFLLDKDAVAMGKPFDMDDVRQGNRGKVIQLLKGLHAWEKRRAALQPSSGKGLLQAGEPESVAR